MSTGQILLGRLIFLSLIITLIIAVGFAERIPLGELQNAEPLSFWRGVWHGYALPYAFIGSIFSDDITIYAPNNNGMPYEAGFLMGAILAVGPSLWKDFKKRYWS